MHLECPPQGHGLEHLDFMHRTSGGRSLVQTFKDDSPVWPSVLPDPNTMGRIQLQFWYHLQLFQHPSTGQWALPPLNLICRGYGWRDGESTTIGQCTCSSDWDVPSSKLTASKHYQRSKAPLTSLTLPTSYLGSSHLKWTWDTSISRQLAQVVQCKACFITTCCVFHVANWDVQIPAAFNHHS